jgi:hypothetical protein
MCRSLLDSRTRIERGSVMQQARVELTRSEPVEHPNPRGRQFFTSRGKLGTRPSIYMDCLFVLRPTLPNVKCVCEVGSWTSAGRHIVLSFCSCRCNLAICVLWIVRNKMMMEKNLTNKPTEVMSFAFLLCRNESHCWKPERGGSDRTQDEQNGGQNANWI